MRQSRGAASNDAATARGPVGPTVERPPRNRNFERAALLFTTRFLTVAISLILVLPCAASADEVWLLNGDVMTGTAQTMDGGVLIFKTAYAENVKVAWRNVAGLETG